MLTKFVTHSTSREGEGQIQNITQLLGQYPGTCIAEPIKHTETAYPSACLFLLEDHAGIFSDMST